MLPENKAKSLMALGSFNIKYNMQLLSVSSPVIYLIVYTDAFKLKDIGYLSVL